MIQRTIFRQPRAINSSLRITSRSSSAPSTLRSHLPTARFAFNQPQRRIGARFYSVATEATKPSDGEVSSPSEEGIAEPIKKEEDPVKKELEAKNREIIDLKDKYLRSVADFRNLQDRTSREIKSAKDYAITKFAKDLIDSVDNLERALSTVPPPSTTSTPTTTTTSNAPPSTQTYPPQEPQEPEDISVDTSASSTNTAEKDLQNLSDGLKMTERIFLQTLEKHGLSRFDPSVNSERFDPNLHEATFMVKQLDKVDGSVFHTQQKGFLLNGRVLRAAKVGVVKNS
ncbi:MAG: hypothetical protein M1812_004264 [Candelaria pacifica]|nr:MAG: hypothetical protein M1812_004264 [Candelaria pacifica]